MVRKVSTWNLQDFVEGRLAQKDRPRVRAHLRANSKIRMRIEKLRRQADMMRTLGEVMMSEPIPAHLTELLRNNPRRRTTR